MKKLLKVLRALCVIALAVCLQASSCDKDDDNNDSGGNRQTSVQTGPVWFSDSQLKFRVDACERVGQALVIDFTVTNRSEQSVSGLEIYNDYNTAVTLSSYYDYSDRVRDNLGEAYWNGVYMGIGKYFRSHSEKVGTLASGESRQCHLIVGSFGLENNATRVSVDRMVKASNVRFQDCYDQNKGYGILRFLDVPITDKRPKEGVMTADRHLGFTCGKLKSDGQGNLVADFTVTNSSDETLKKLLLVCRMGCTDEYDRNCNLDFTIDNSDYGSYHELDIAAGKTVKGVIRLIKPNATSSKFNWVFETTAESRLMEDDLTRFINITK